MHGTIRNLRDIRKAHKQANATQQPTQAETVAALRRDSVLDKTIPINFQHFFQRPERGAGVIEYFKSKLRSEGSIGELSACNPFEELLRDIARRDGL